MSEWRGGGGVVIAVQPAVGKVGKVENEASVIEMCTGAQRHSNRNSKRMPPPPVVPWKFEIQTEYETFKENDRERKS